MKQKREERTKCRFIVATIVFSLFATSSLFAADGARTLSFADALNLAHANSPDYKIADITRDDTILNSSIAKDWIPSINLSSGLYSGGVNFFGPDTNDIKWTTNATSSLNLSLGINFTLSADKFFNFAKLDATKESADAVYNQTIQSYDSSVFSTYWGLKSYELALEAAQTSYDSAKSTYDNVLKKYNNGMASSLDKANAELSLSSAESKLISAKTYAEKAKIALKTQIGYDGQMPFVLDDVPEAVELNLPDADKLYSEYINSSYSVRVSRASESALKTNLESVKWSAYTPSISLGLNYSIMAKDDDFIPSDYRDNLGITLSARMSLDGFIPGTTTYNQIKTLDNNAKIATLQRQKTESNLLANIEDALGTLKSNYESLKTAGITLKSAEESYKLTKESFDNGKSTMESLMNAESTLLNARTGVISANMTYLLSEQNLATVLGITVDDLEQKYKVNTSIGE